jgi:hypothetical protein
MNDKFNNWVTALEEIKDNILNTLDYNGLIIDDIDNLIKAIKEAQKE